MPTDVAVSVAPTKMAAVVRSVEPPLAAWGTYAQIEESEKEGEHDTYGGNRQCGGTGAKHLPQVRFQSDLEQQEHDSELRENVHHLSRSPGGRDNSEDASTQKNAGEQLTEHRRLAHPFRQLTQQLCGHQYGRQRKKQAGNGEFVHG